MTHAEDREVRQPAAETTPLGAPPLGTWHGRYQLLREVERGGMGIVYEGVDRAFDQRVAVKALGPEAPRWVCRCLEREACLGLRLGHPGIVRHLDYFEEEGCRFLVMEWIEGRTFADLLEEDNLSTESALQILSQIAHAVDACHAAGIIHLDVKPENIMILPDGTTKLLDFGLSRSRFHGGNERRWIEGELMGTPHYMAPEIILGSARRLRPAADVYALGVILYKILTGTLPHVGQRSEDVLQHAVEEEIVSPRWIDPGISPRLERVCFQALASSPSRRFESALQFVHELEFALGIRETQPAGSGEVAKIPSILLFWHSDRGKESGGEDRGSFFFGIRH